MLSAEKVPQLAAEQVRPEEIRHEHQSQESFAGRGLSSRRVLTMRPRFKVLLALLLNALAFVLVVWPVLADPLQGG